MPSASVTTTVMARPFARRSERIAKRMSCASAPARSRMRGRQTLRIESRVSVTLPNSFSAARRADAGSSPLSMRSLILMARGPPISCSRSSLSGMRGGIVASLLAGRRRVHDAPDGVDELRPAILLAGQLRLAGGGQRVVLRALVRLADAPLGLEPAA